MTLSAGVLPDQTHLTVRLRRWAGTALGLVILLCSGIGFRLTDAAVAAEMDRVIRLDPPLSSLPLTLGDWVGHDLPLSEAIQRIAGNDDFVHREYCHTQTRERVYLYVGYTANPRTMLRHRPTVCYPSAGYTHLFSRETDLDRTTGLRGLLHGFLKPGLVDQRVVVLNYYILAGSYTIDETSFWGVGWRIPNLSADTTRYVAQVQVMAPISREGESATAAIEAFAIDCAPELRRLLPGSAGYVAPVPR